MSASLVTSPVVAAAISAGQTTKAMRSAPAPVAQPLSFGRNVSFPATTRQVSLSASRPQRVNVATVVSAGYAPPTVGDTKAKLLELYPMPIPNMYNVVLQELLVQQHFVRYNINYQYDQIYALGICSIYDQILGGEGTMIDSEAVFSAYIGALGEEPATYRADAKALEEAVSAMGSSDELKVDADGNVVQKALADIKARQEEGKFHYSRFFAVGLFRMLELAGATDPKALETLVAEVGVSKAQVASDLAVYKGVLSKLNSAKELMKDFLERERKVNEERLKAKAEKADAEA